MLGLLGSGGVSLAVGSGGGTAYEGVAETEGCVVT